MTVPPGGPVVPVSPGRGRQAALSSYSMFTSESWARAAAAAGPGDAVPESEGRLAVSRRCPGRPQAEVRVQPGTAAAGTPARGGIKRVSSSSSLPRTKTGQLLTRILRRGVRPRLLDRDIGGAAFKFCGLS